MKLKKVISGIKTRSPIEQLTVFTDERVVFCGTWEQWKATSVDMILYKQKIENSEVKKRMDYHGKVFLFIEDEEARNEA